MEYPQYDEVVNRKLAESSTLWPIEAAALSAAEDVSLCDGSSQASDEGEVDQASVNMLAAPCQRMTFPKSLYPTRESALKEQAKPLERGSGASSHHVVRDVYSGARVACPVSRHDTQALRPVLECDIREEKECCRSIHLQSELPRSFFCLALSFDRPAHFSPGKTQWEVLTEEKIEGKRCCFGQLVWYRTKLRASAL